MHWMRAAKLLYLADNPMKYDEHVSKMLEHFKETTSPYHAERLAKMCWLPQPPSEEREVLEKLADIAFEQRGRRWGSIILPRGHWGVIAMGNTKRHWKISPKAVG